MLQTISSDEHSMTFTLLGKTDSYNKEKNLDIYNQSFNPNYLKNLLKKCIDSSTELSSCKEQNYEHLINRLCQHNPWALFSECFSEHCYLNRLQYPSIRYYFDEQFYKAFTKVEKELSIDKDKELKIASYYPGYFFHDLVISNELISRGYKNLHFYMLIGQSNELIQLYRQTLDPRLLKDDNIDRQNWAICYLWRFIKFMEYLESFDVKVTITILDEFNELMGQMDISIAFDFFDDMTDDPSYISRNVIKYSRIGGLFYSTWQQGPIVRFSQIDCTILVIRNNDWNDRNNAEGVFKHHGNLSETLITSSKWFFKMSIYKFGQNIRNKCLNILGYVGINI